MFTMNIYMHTVHTQTFYIRLQFDHMYSIDMSINFCKYLHHAIKKKSLLSKGRNTILSTLLDVLISLLPDNLVKLYTSCILCTMTSWVFSPYIEINHLAEGLCRTRPWLCDVTLDWTGFHFILHVDLKTALCCKYFLKLTMEIWTWDCICRWGVCGLSPIIC